MFAALAARGFAARVVGGAVRNALVGKPVSEVDIATTARPDEVIGAAEAAGLKAVPTGIAHGTVTVIVGRAALRGHDAAQGRGDLRSSCHRRLHRRLGRPMRRRRDFTINALYCNADGELFDPLGGYPDLAARRVRFIGEADERIREDYLRILRFLRFTAEYGDGAPDAASLAACVRERAGLAQLSPERVRQEMLRLLSQARAPELIEVMRSHGLLAMVLPAVPRPALLDRLAAIEAALGRKGDALLRLAALAVEIPEDAERLRTHWRLSNEEAATLLRVAVRPPGIDPSAPEQRARWNLYKYGEDAFRHDVLIEWTRSGAKPDDPGWRNRLALPERWQAPKFPIGGADVMALGVPAGPRVGMILSGLEGWWMGNDFAPDETELRAKLREVVEELERDQP